MPKYAPNNTRKKYIQSFTISTAKKERILKEDLVVGIPLEYLPATLRVQAIQAGPATAQVQGSQQEGLLYPVR
jgi:hypothetical protein